MKKYIIRTDRAGVFYAGIESRKGDEANLVDARRIFYWDGATECIQISQEGLDSKNSKLTMPAESLTVLGVIEVHPVTDKAQKVLESVPVWKK